VVSDKNRQAVFVELASGEKDPVRIAKKHRLLAPAVERVLGEFEAEKLVRRDPSGYVLTEEGERVAADLRRQDLLKT